MCASGMHGGSVYILPTQGDLVQTRCISIVVVHNIYLFVYVFYKKPELLYKTSQGAQNDICGLLYEISQDVQNVMCDE